ncbi:hypothetical protein TKK_0004848 [Trichogramma kaykai]|uniref:Uncharacterized protein n=1 Tax=Trichogramma kaykai TaxID=54128 RepID=A0ABD2XK89_9HYME
MQSYAFAGLCDMKSLTIFLLLAITAAEARNCGDPYHKIDQVIERVPKPPQKPWSSGDSSLEDDGGKASNEVNDKPAQPPQRAGQRTSGGGKNSAPAEDYIMKGDPHALDEINKQMDEMRKPLDYDDDDDDDVHEVARPETFVQKEPQPPPPPPKQQQEWQQQPQKQPPQSQSEKQQQQQQSYVIGIPIILPMFNMQFSPPGSKQQQTAIIKVVY